MADLNDFIINGYKKSVKDLADKPEMSAAELKAWFDGRTDDEVKSMHNAFVRWAAENLSTTSEVANAIESKMSAIGAGDMQKSVYDKNGTGAVDKAEVANTSLKLLTERKIKLTGGIDAEGKFDGSTDIEIRVPVIYDNTKLPLKGGNMAGYIDFAQSNQGLSWTAADGTIYKLRAWSPTNVMQLTRTPKGGAEKGILTIYTNNAEFDGNAATATTAGYASKSGEAEFAAKAKNRAFYIGDASVLSIGSQYLRINPNDTEAEYGVMLGVYDSGWRFCPANSGQLTLGSPSLKWNEVYANNGAIITSDRNEKHDIESADSEKMIEFLMKLRPVAFKYNSGTSGRVHYGFIAQEVEQAMQECGISGKEFAGFIKSPKYIRADTGKKDENGNAVFEEIIIEGEFFHGLRYEEFIAPMLSFMQRQKQRCDEFEERIRVLEGGAR